MPEAPMLSCSQQLYHTHVLIIHAADDSVVHEWVCMPSLNGIAAALVHVLIIHAADDSFTQKWFCTPSLCHCSCSDSVLPQATQRYARHSGTFLLGYVYFWTRPDRFASA